MRQARSQVGSPRAVADGGRNKEAPPAPGAKSVRPPPPRVCAAGACFSLSRKSATSAECRSVGSRFLSSLIASSRWPQPDRGIVKDGAAARQTGIGARQQIDPDTLLECLIGPQTFDDDHPFLHPRSAAGMDDEAALPIAEAHPVAIAETQLPQHLGMDKGGRPTLAGDARWRVVEARIE